MPPIGAVQNPGQSPETPIPLYYTGKDINATSGLRTANTNVLQVGEVLLLDPFGPDSGRGTDVANATAGFLAQKPFVVTKVPRDSRLGGWIEGVPSAHNISAFTKANMTAGTTFLGVTAATRYFSALTSIAALVNIYQVCAIAHETVDTSGVTGGQKANVGFGLRGGL